MEREESVIPSLSRDMQYHILDKWFREFEETIEPFDKDVVRDFFRTKVTNAKDYPWLVNGLNGFLSQDSQENIAQLKQEEDPLLERDHSQLNAIPLDEENKVHLEVAEAARDDMTSDVIRVAEEENILSGPTKNAAKESPSSSSDVEREEDLFSTNTPIMPSLMMRLIFPFTRMMDKVVSDGFDAKSSASVSYEKIRKQQEPEVESQEQEKTGEGERKQEVKDYDNIQEHYISSSGDQEGVKVPGTEAENEGDVIVLHQESYGVVMLPTESHSERFTADEDGLGFSSQTTLDSIPSSAEEPTLTTKEVSVLQREKLNPHDYWSNAVDVKADMVNAEAIDVKSSRNEHQERHEESSKNEETKENPLGIRILMTSSGDDVGSSSSLLRSLVMMSPSLISQNFLPSNRGLLKFSFPSIFQSMGNPLPMTFASPRTFPSQFQLIQ